MGDLPTSGWKNKGGTEDRECASCGSWKKHWIRLSGKSWPTQCSFAACYNSASLGAHVINSKVSGEKIVPACDSCNKLKSTFSLKGGVTLVQATQCS